LGTNAPVSHNRGNNSTAANSKVTTKDTEEMESKIKYELRPNLERKVGYHSMPYKYIRLQHVDLCSARNCEQF